MQQDFTVHTPFYDICLNFKRRKKSTAASTLREMLQD